MTTPTPPIPTFTDGTVVHQGDLNALGSNITNLYNFTLGGFVNAPPLCIVNQTSGQALTATEASITFNTAVVNISNMWVSSVPSQLTVNVAGTYLLTGQVVFGNTAVAGYDYIGITVNGTGAANRIVTQAYTSSASSVAGPTLSCSTSYRLSAGATIFLRAATSMSATTGLGNLLNSSLVAVWLSP